METVDLAALPLQGNFPGLGVTFPVSSATGTAATATVYMEFEPGAALPEHQDSAEEILLVLEGSVEATVGDERGQLATGELAVVPAMAPHGLRNTGEVRARVLGFFGGSTNVATFAQPVGPSALQVFVVGAPVPVAAPLAEALALSL